MKYLLNEPIDNLIILKKECVDQKNKLQLSER